jgi:diguanylate cyclase (GGDEF)-like protein
MLSWMSPTDVAFAMVALLQAVLAVVWLLGSSLIGDTRRAAVHWSAFSAFSALGFLLLTLALHAPTPARAELLRAGGNLGIVLGLIALQRGVWLFVGRPIGVRAHALVLVLALAASYIGLAPAGAMLRVATLSILLALLAFVMARDLHRYARDALHFRWAWGMALPGAIAGFAFLFRGSRALLWPASIGKEMTTDSALNVGAALLYVVIVLSFHATLIALVVGRLLADLRHRSRHDALTGLLNRRAIEEAVEAQMRRSQRSGEVFSVLMLDLDDFKSINDRFGHAVGDQALRHVATLLKAGVREIDDIARIGGEEFLALMPGAPLAAAQPVAERLREQLALHPLQLGADEVPVRVSIGIAQSTDHDEDMSRLLVRADAALYRAKQTGRNRVVAAAVEAPSLRLAAVRP